MAEERWESVVCEKGEEENETRVSEEGTLEYGPRACRYQMHVNWRYRPGLNIPINRHSPSSIIHLENVIVSPGYNNEVDIMDESVAII